MAVSPFRCTLFWVANGNAVFSTSTSDPEIPRRLASLHPFAYHAARNNSSTAYRALHIKTPVISMTIFEVSLVAIIKSSAMIPFIPISINIVVFRTYSTSSCRTGITLNRRFCSPSTREQEKSHN